LPTACSFACLLLRLPALSAACSFGGLLFGRVRGYKCCTGPSVYQQRAKDSTYGTTRFSYGNAGGFYPRVRFGRRRHRAERRRAARIRSPPHARQADPAGVRELLRRASILAAKRTADPADDDVCPRRAAAGVGPAWHQACRRVQRVRRTVLAHVAPDHA